MRFFDKVRSPAKVICTPYSVEESFLGNYFFGQTDVLNVERDSYAWGGLFNPGDSGINLFWNVYTISNFARDPFNAEIWLNSSLAEQGKISTHVTSSNQLLRFKRQPQTQIKYADQILTPSMDGIFSFLRRVEPNSTLTRHDFQGLIILPPGGSAIVLIRPSGQNQIHSQIAFGWWEEKIPINHKAAYAKNKSRK